METNDEYRACERLEREVWGGQDIVADHILITAQKNGGLVLGAFGAQGEGESEHLVGFLFGFVGLTPQGIVKHCSHVMGVSPTWQGRGVGYRLKLAQRERVLAQNIDLITWTFDPLESRNARLNFRKLGAVCTTYLPNLYGDMREQLNEGLPSDRFQVDWHIRSRHVADRLERASGMDDVGRLLASGAVLVNPMAGENLPCQNRDLAQLDGPLLLVQIPSRFQSVKSSDMGLARAWRFQLREICQQAFERGYVVTDLVVQDDQVFYVLEENREIL